MSKIGRKHLLPVMLMVLLLSGITFGIDYGFDGGSLQGWTDLTVPNPSQTEGPRNFALSPPAWGDGGTQAGSGKIGQNIVGGGQDNGHPTLLLRSPEFKLNGAGDFSCWLCGGDGWLDDSRATIVGKEVSKLPPQAFDSPFDPTYPSFMGVALRNVNTGKYVLAGHKNNGGGGGTDWQKITAPQAALAQLDQNAVYTVDLIDARVGGWGWIVMDSVTIPGSLVAAQNPVPANGAPRVTIANASWDASAAFPSTTYTVWRNTEPNSTSATNVGTTATPAISLGTLPGTLAYNTKYYWRVDVSDPNNGGTPIVYPGVWWSFTTAAIQPYFSTQPQRIQAVLNETVQFTAVAETLDGSTISYQWFKRNGAVVDPASSPSASGSLTLNSVSAASAGLYFCRATSAGGSTDSSDARLYVRRGLVNRYGFDGNVNDAVSNANGTVIQGTGTNPGSIAFAAGKMTMTNPNGANSNNTAIAYVDLPNGIVSSLGNQMTLAVWVNPNPVITWTRIVDFGISNGGENISDGGGVNFLTLVARANSDGGTVASELKYLGQGGSRQAMGLLQLPQGQESFVALTINENTGMFRIYVDGQQVGQVALAPGTLMDFNDVNNWLGRAQYGDRGFNGAYNELRIYDEALSAGWIKAMYETGPDAIPANACVTPPATDVNGDCRVDLTDLAAMATEWLNCGLIDCRK